jgi:hypothetical protein
MLSLRNFEKSPAIYSISVDSRSRPPNEPVNKYHINLNSNLQRVRTVQLGSIYIPAQAIQAIGDTLNNNILYMEPIPFTTAGTMIIQETLTVIENGNKTVTAFPPVTITFPPTLNKIVSVSDPMGVGPNSVITTLNHGLLAGTLEWSKAGLNISLVGGLYPASAVVPSTTAYGPQVTFGNIAITGNQTFDFNTGYLNTLATPPQSARNTQPGLGDSYIYAEPPTLSELLMMLNNWLNMITNYSNLAPTGNTLILPIVFELSDSTNSLVVKAGSYDQVIGNKRYIVSSTILGTGTLNPLLGLVGDVNLDQPHCYTLSTLPYVKRADLDHGTFLQSELETMVSGKLSPLDFTGLPAASRTFHWADTGGVDRALVILEGRYIGDQLALELQTLMQAATGGVNYSVLFNNGKFTFSSTVNVAIGLNFLLGVQFMASALGFQYQNYSSSPSYTSPFSIGTSFPVTSFQLTGDTICQRFTLAAKSVPSVLSNAVIGAVENWNTLTVTAAKFVPGGFYPNQVLQATVTGPGLPPFINDGDVFTVIVGGTWDGDVAADPYITILRTVSVFGVNGIGAPSAVLNIYLTPLRRNVAQFMFAGPQAAAELLGFTKQTLPVNRYLNQVMNADEPNVYYLASGGGIFGLGAASSFTGPFLYNLLGPDYILMRVLNDCDANTSNEHSYLQNSWNILAKMYLRPNYQHISEEMLHVAFAGMKRITSLYVEFINPDGSLVDFNGRDHTYSLLFTAEVKFASTICM